MNKIERLESGMRGILEGFVTLSEENEDFYRKVVERDLDRLCLSGEISQIAEEIGGTQRDAIREASNALWRPLYEARASKELSEDHTLTDGMVWHRAKQKGLSYREALTELSEEGWQL